MALHPMGPVDAAWLQEMLLLQPRSNGSDGPAGPAAPPPQPARRRACSLDLRHSCC